VKVEISINDIDFQIVRLKPIIKEYDLLSY